MNPLEQPENAVMENESEPPELKPSVPFTTGSTAYTKPLFSLVKCRILALPWSLNECLDADSDESFDGLKVRWFWSSISSRFLRVMNYKRCYSGSVVIGRVFFPIIQRWWEHLERHQLRSEDLCLVECRVEAKSLAQTFKVSRGVLAHILIFSASKRIADWRSGSLMRELYYEKPLRLCIKIKNSHVLGRSRSLVLPQHLILFPPLFLYVFCR